MSCTKDKNTDEPASTSDVETLPVLTATPIVGQSYKFSPEGATCSDDTKATDELHSLSREILDSFHGILCSFVDWLNNAVNGKVESYGLNLLND